VRILHITNVDEAGGTNTNCLQFIRASPAAHTLAVLDGPGQMQARWPRERVEVRYLNLLRGDRARLVRELGKTVDDIKPDAILLWCCIRIPLIRFALRHTAARLGIHLGNPRTGGVWADRLLQAQAVALPSTVETRLFSCSEHVRRSFATGYWQRFENRVIYNPIDLPEVLAVPTAAPASCLGMVARLDRIKDHATLIRAAARLRDQGVGFALELVGDGPARAELEQLVDRLDLRATVRFLGYLENVPERLARWSLFVYSTTEREGLGNSVVEALGAGLPCVVSDLPMMREIDGGTGLMSFFRAADPVDCAAKIGSALRDPQLRARVGAAGRAHARARHDPAGYCAQIMAYLAGDRQPAEASA